MSINLSKFIVYLFLSVLVLLPFSRLAELPILILAIFGIYTLAKQGITVFAKPQIKILSIVYFCYFLMILLSAPDSFWQKKTLIVGVSSLRFYLATIAILVLTKSQDRKLMIPLITGLIIFWTIDALIQYFVGFDLIGRETYPGRLNGIFGTDQVKLGPVIALLMPVVMIGLIQINSLVRWILILAMIAVIILSGTRSAWLMMIFVLFAYWLHHVKTRRFILLMKTAVVAIVLLVSLWFISPEFQNRIERSMAVLDGSQSGLDFALANRLPIWQTSWNMFSEHPINGVGAHAFRNAYSQYAESDDVWQKQGGVGMHAHHWLLEILSETGLAGLLLMIFAMYQLIKFVKLNYDPSMWPFMVAIVCAFLPFVSIYSLFSSFWSICIWFCGAGLLMMSHQDD
ncbi:MAG: O-antigen ligase family protein [Xanthomonadales bacterium]|nr:O-antigen ligase family protein [Xanthomonadales bacterium]